MTVREYIIDKMRAFDVSEALLEDFVQDSTIPLDVDTSEVSRSDLGIAMVHMLEEMVLMPRPSGFSEGGFSQSWNFDGVGKYYVWLCRKWGITPDEDVASILGITHITDRSDIW